MTLNFKFFSAGTFVYLGIGFLIHMIAIGTTIVWSDAFALFVIVLWPFYLVYLVLWILMWIAGLCIVGFLIYCVYCKVTGRSI